LKTHCKHGHRLTAENTDARGRCRRCICDVSERYRAANHERVIEAQRAYLANNRELNRERCAAYHAEHREQINAHQRKYHATVKHHPEFKAKRRREYLLAKYGVDEVWFEAKLIEQRGCCAICQKEFSGRPHIDHCHASLVVRSLLCGQCNRGLGMFYDNPRALRAAADYLDKHDERRSAPEMQN
jgi:hypothetical protein